MINGIVNVYKEKGFTSFDVVAVMRGMAGQKKVGHTGTLDPDACGVLPVCLGNATKLCDMLTDKKKEYVAVFMLGKRTDTLDISGEVLETRDVFVTPEKLTETIKSFIGGYEQIPPMYSAKKIDGKKLVDIARSGKVIERKPVFVMIHDIAIEKIDLPYFSIRVSCGKGTYIRSLGEDIAAACGELATMTELTRTRVDAFSIEEAYKLSELKQLKEQGKLAEAVLPTDRAFMDKPAVYVREEGRKAIANGNALAKTMLEMDFAPTDGLVVRVYDCDKNFVALYTYKKENNRFEPYKMFFGDRQ